MFHWVSLGMLMIFLFWALYYDCNMQYTWSSRICCHGYNLITTLEGLTRTHPSTNLQTRTHPSTNLQTLTHPSTNLQTAIHWCSLKQNCALKLMQIWKFHYMFGFIYKQYPENFGSLILRTLELFTREVCMFLKK